jgi:hypothetical protein
MTKPSMKAQFVAERTLVCAEDPEQRIVVRLAKPACNPKTKDYECVFRITGRGVSLVRFAAGFDGVQALQLALVMIGAEIGRIEKALGIRLRFGDLGDAGFAR